MATMQYEEHTFALPVGLGLRIKAVQKTLDQIEWSPVQVLNLDDLAIPEVCPRCGKQASTVAQQLTYQHGEMPTLLFWCLSRHAWKWNSFEGRVIMETAAT